MNSFMNALWTEGVGSTVTGYRMGKPFLGTISAVRVKYGNDLSVTVQYDAGSVEETGDCGCIIDGKELFEGKGGAYENLHVYFGEA